MDQRLYDAARTGDIIALDALRNADPLILNKVCLAHFAETPLHVAALAGQSKFAKEIIRLMPSFARELNREGFAPMHVASARGDEDILMELLKLDEDCSLCLQRDNSGQIPLHYAVGRGRIPVIEKLISHCVESLQEVTALGETAFHLAVKNSQFGALKVVLERLNGLECSQTLLSMKDYQGRGKTIAELAEATQQLQVQELLKEYQNGHADDASAKCSDNDEIMELAADKQADQHQTEISSLPETDGKHNEKQESKEEKKKQSKFELENLLLVAAVLIATVTYQAVATPPTSVWEKGINLNATCIFNKSHEKMNYTFQKLKQDCPALMYYIFMMFNTAGFVSSLFLILIVTLRYDYIPLQLLAISIILLIVNYGMLIVGLSPNASSIYIILFSNVLIQFFLWIILLSTKGKCPWASRQGATSLK